MVHVRSPASKSRSNSLNNGSVTRTRLLKLFYITSTFITLDPIFNVTNETPSNASLYTLLNQELRILVSMNLLEI
jgi:hypothetical protein